MGLASSKKSLSKIEDNPKDYRRYFVTRWNFDGRDWLVVRSGAYIIIREPNIQLKKFEYLYQFRFVHQYHLKPPFVKRGIGKGQTCFDINGWKSESSFNFQVIVYAFIEENGIRIFNFKDEKVYGRSKLFGDWLHVPMEFLSRRAPLLAPAIRKNKVEGTSTSGVYQILQILHGVHLKLIAKNIGTILKRSIQYNLFYVKRYCEHQLIRRDDLEFSKLQKYELACKYDLGLLMRQLLVDIESTEELKEFVFETIGIDKMNGKMMKLIAEKIFERT